MFLLYSEIILVKLLLKFIYFLANKLIKTYSSYSCFHILDFEIGGYPIEGLGAHVSYQWNWVIWWTNYLFWVCLFWLRRFKIWKSPHTKKPKTFQCFLFSDLFLAYLKGGCHNFPNFDQKSSWYWDWWENV